MVSMVGYNPRCPLGLIKRKPPPQVVTKGPIIFNSVRGSGEKNGGACLQKWKGPIIFNSGRGSGEKRGGHVCKNGKLGGGLPDPPPELKMTDP